MESAVCLALFYGAFWLFLKKETYFHLNRFYLISSLLLSLIIPLLNIPSPFRYAPAAEEFVRLPLAPSLPARAVQIERILFMVYAAGVLLFLIRFVIHLAKLYLVVKKCGIRRYHCVAVVSVDKDFSPFSFLNVIFINDQELSEGNLHHILAHEQAHIRQHHSLDIIFIELVAILQWFNPFVRPYKKSIQETHEYLADDEVIAQGFSAAKYQLLMLEQHVGVKLFEFANNFKQSQFKRRITMMSKTKSRNAAKLKLLLVMPLASFLVLAFADPKLAAKAGSSPIPSPQLSADQGQETQITKEKVFQAKEELKALREKEALLRKEMVSVSDPGKKKDFETTLQKVLQKEEKISAFLQKAGAIPPSNGNGESESGRGGGKPTEFNGVKDGNGLESEYKLLSEKEMKIRQVLENTEDPEKKAELKASLVEVLEKKDQVKAVLQANGSPEKTSIEDLKKEYMLLSEKAAEIRVMLEKTEDPEKKTDLQNTLKKVLQKQESIKAKAEALKTSKIEKSK